MSLPYLELLILWGNEVLFTEENGLGLVLCVAGRLC